MQEFAQTKQLKRYLFAFFFFNTGVQTVMLMATLFAKKEIVDIISQEPRLVVESPIFRESFN